MRKKKRKSQSISIVLSAVLLLSGCSWNADEQDDIVILEQEEERSEYTLAAATIEDVTASATVHLVYTQVNREDYFFDLGGKTISSVYVEEGDSVRRGDLLAELASENLNLDIEKQQYQIKKSELLLQQTLEDQNIEIAMVNQKYQNKEQTEEIQKEWAEAAQEIRDKYKYVLQDCQDEIDKQYMMMDKLLEEREKTRIYAQLTGTVTFVKKGLEGSESRAGQTIITVVDDSEGYFKSEEIQYKDYFTEGVPVEAKITHEGSMGTAELIPYRMDTWTDQIYFAVWIEPETVNLAGGARADVDLILEQRTQVLAVPVKAVHEADGKMFVYVLGDNQIREVKFISVGIYGDTYVEVTDGLAEGDRVIVK